ncbi:hypothetical protein PybrP1_003922, partial [[Pythium] brassicae (nom. inval.)]
MRGRRTTWNFIKALLWKNALLKRRHYVATALEVLLPMLFILLLGLLKNLTDDVNVPAGWSDELTRTSDESAGTSYNLYQSAGSLITWVPAVLPKFNMPESTLTGVLLSLGYNAVVDGLKLDELSNADYTACVQGVAVRGATATDPASPHRVPAACADKVAPYKIGIVPDNTFTREYFLQTMDAWYPRVRLENSSSAPEVPSLRDSVAFFPTVEAFEDYVAGNDYGSGAAFPRIHAGIVFDAFPDDAAIGAFSSIEYTLRLNSTLGRRGAIGRIPRTIGDPPQVLPFQRKIETEYYSRYAVTGFMTLQTLVTRFVTCMPTWDAATKTTTGACQRPQATAKPSDDLDLRLLATLNSDPHIKGAMTLFGSATATGSASFASILAAMPAASREALLKPLRQAPQPFLGASVAPFPIEGYTNSPFYDSVKNVFALVFVLAYLYTISRILVVFIQEKESRMREFMKILGVKEKAILISWYITYTGILLVGTVLQALAGQAGLFEKSSVVLIFIFFFLFGMSVLAYGFLVSTVFSKSRTGAFVGMVVFFLMYFISSAFSTETAENAKNMGCILSPVALTLGVRVLANLESTGQGIAFSNIDWYFPVSPSYWRNRRKARLAAKATTTSADAGAETNVVVELDPNFEPVNGELRDQERTGATLSVQGLRKVFAVPGGEKVAVKGMNLTMYKGQITCLLGHNGAGKTTLISMLTGMTAPSGGDATFHGMSFTEDMDEIRESLGICFQHD